MKVSFFYVRTIKIAHNVFESFKLHMDLKLSTKEAKIKKFSKVIFVQSNSHVDLRVHSDSCHYSN